MGQTILDCDSTRAPSKVALMTSFSICVLGLLNRLIMAHGRGVECMTLILSLESSRPQEHGWLETARELPPLGPH